MKLKKEKNWIMNEPDEKETIPCDFCGKPLGQDEDQIGRKCRECLAEDESCGCSDV